VPPWQILEFFKRKRRRELIFKGGNRDGDEFIDFETFCEMPTYAGRSEEELRSVFEQFQVDHQGRIDRRELDSHKREDQGKADECGCDISFINELRVQCVHPSLFAALSDVWWFSVCIRVPDPTARSLMSFRHCVTQTQDLLTDEQHRRAVELGLSSFVFKSSFSRTAATGIR